MSDGHMRILHYIARQTQRELEDHDTVEAAGDAGASRRLGRGPARPVRRAPGPS